MKDTSSQTGTIYINGRFLTQPVSGVQAFARSICMELIENKANIKIVVPEGSVIKEPIMQPYLLFSGSRGGHFWEQMHLPGFINKQKHGILLNLCNTGPVNYKNQVVTIHDLAFLINPKWFHPAFRLWYKFMVPKLIRNSKHILTVSESIKNELIDYFKLDANKITVVANKVSESLIQASEEFPARLQLSEKNFFLMVGSDDPRKNFAFAENEFVTGEHKARLVIAGGKNRNFGTTNHIESPYILRTGYISDPELKWLYKHAVALINPSLYEGFGVPNLEAFAMNCPVLCSDISVFKEVCGDASIYFDPNNKESLKESIRAVSKKNELIDSKTTKGKVIFTNYQNQNRSFKIIKALFE